LDDGTTDKEKTMDKKLQDLYQDQIKNEWYSAYFYLSMVSYFESINLDGMAKWMKKQAAEEQAHGQKMFDFLSDRGVRVILQAITQPPSDFSSPLDVFERTLEHEKKVTGLIHAIADASEKANDHPSKVFIQWFVMEQVEEEKNATKIVETLKKFKPDSGAIYHFDRQLGKRE
jgi:ferritin